MGMFLRELFRRGQRLKKGGCDLAVQPPLWC
jgi:hypothetical protein